MIVKNDGGSDVVVSFDAFKVSKHARHPVWRVEALVPWARDIMSDRRCMGVATSNRAIVLGSRDPRHLGEMPATQFGYGLGFERKSDATSFLRDLELKANEWWKS